MICYKLKFAEYKVVWNGSCHKEQKLFIVNALS